jgi:hypothetical protein
MQKGFIFICLIINIMPLTAYTQEILKPFRIGISLGCSFTGYRDEVESPINRYLNALTFIIDGNIEKGGYFHSFNINFFTGSFNVKSLYEGISSSQYVSYRGSIDYAVDRRLWGSETFPGYLGGGFRMIFYLTGDNDRLNPSPPTGAFSAAFEIHASQKWNINAKNTLILSAGFPLFGYAIRPAYASMDEYWMKYLYENKIKIITLGNFTSVHNYLALLGDLKYIYKLDDLFSVYSGLGFELSRINFPKPRIDTIGRLIAGISFTF